MKAFVHVVLPRDVDPLDEAAVRASVDAQMAPFWMDQPETYTDPRFPYTAIAVETHWDYCWICAKEDHADWGDELAWALPASPILVGKVETIGGWCHSLLTPDGRWHQSRASYTTQDPDWPANAARIAAPFSDHFAAIVYYHG